MPRRRGQKASSPDPSGLAAVNPANPQSRNAYAYVTNQPLTATDPLGLMTISIGFGGGPCEMFAGPCGGGFGGPGPCDVAGWNPWPAPGCSGGGLGGGIGISIIGFGGGGGGGGTVAGTPSGPASGPMPPCTAGIRSPASLASARDASPGADAGAFLNALINACAGNGLCVAGAGALGGPESPLLSNLTQKPPAESGGPFWKRPGCGKALSEIAGGIAITVAEGAFVWWAAPEAAAMIAEEGAWGPLTALHVAPAAAMILFPGVLLATQGVAQAKSCGW
jgi:hypothetical protein